LRSALQKADNILLFFHVMAL